MAVEEQQPASKRAKLQLVADPQPSFSVGRSTTWRIYPRPAGRPRSYAVGDRVFFRPKSAKEDGKRGTVVEQATAEGHHVLIQFENRTTSMTNTKIKSISSKRLVPLFVDDEDGLSIIFTSETTPYRHLASSQVCKNDDVVEIGCSTGETSAILTRYGRSLVGFDTSSDMIEQCTSKLKSSTERYSEDDATAANTTDKLWRVCKMNALADPKGALQVANEFCGSKGPSVVFLDIGGNREEAGVVNMMSFVMKSFENLRLMVIKSREVVKILPTDRIEATTGIFSKGAEWFQEKAQEISRQQRKTTPHPLQAPLVYSPEDSTKPICRYHNYDSQGCRKGDRCPYDHIFCHLCLDRGHRAIHCEQTVHQ